LIGAMIGAGRGHNQGLADSPKAQQADAKLALHAGRVTLRLEVSFDRVANVGGNVLKIRQAVGRSRDAFPVILDRQILTAMLSATGDRDCLGVRVDAVFHELRDGLERVALREGDNAYGIPIVANPKFAFPRDAYLV